MNHLSRLVIATYVLAATLAGRPAAAERSTTDLEREEFLRRAEIVHTEPIPVGITRPLRATLSLDGRTHDAHIQQVDTPPRHRRTRQGVVVLFRDCYRYNIAAYRLDRLLGLEMVPVSVERWYRGKPAAVTWWIDDVLMSAADRHEQKISPPDMLRWIHQQDQAWIFHQLVWNQDPNLGNFLIDADWRLWLVDFTRAFRTLRELPEPQRVQRISRRLYEGLHGLTLEAVRRETASQLSSREAAAVVARRDVLLELLAERVEARGERQVIFDPPPARGHHPGEG